MKRDLTLARIRNTDFSQLYKKFILEKELSLKDMQKILTIATIFLNSNNKDIQNFGYRIILIYCNRSKDYRPLYEVALNLGYIPVAKSIDRMIDNLGDTFYKLFNSAFFENFHQNKIYMSEQQLEISKFFSEYNFETISVIAPTSYGKTELILSLLRENENKKICIITPTKSLLAQTKIRIINAQIDWIKKVVIQSEMYTGNEKSLVAVLTQERLLRLLKMFPQLKFDFAIIDEAHGLLNDDERSRLLAEVILILEKRNSEIAFKFLTPFLGDSGNLRIKFADIGISEYKVSEYIKSERFYIYDEKDSKTLKFYDQFINEFYEIGKLKLNMYRFITHYCGDKNIIYLNKPKDIEYFSTNHKERINLAIVRIKEEQDYLDNIIMKYIEVLNDLCLVDEILYLKIKYGTSDKRKVLLVKNGLSLGLSNLIVDKYVEYLVIDYESNSVEYIDGIIEAMIQNEENEVLLYELKYFIEK